MPEKQCVDSITYASFIIPVVPKGEILTVHVVLVKSSKVHPIVPKKNSNDYFYSTDNKIINPHVIMLDLINVNDLSVMKLFRCLNDNYPLMDRL